MTAASAPSSAASTHVNVDSRRTLMPTSSVAVGSWLAPMMASPRFVLVKNRPSTTARTASVPMSHSRWSETCTPKMVIRSRRERPCDRAPLVVEEPLLEGDREEGDARCGHQHDDPRRLEQRADDDALGEEAEQHPGQRARPDGQAVRHAARVEEVERADGHATELALGEVEHAARLVDEHQAEGHEPVRRPTRRR